MIINKRITQQPIELVKATNNNIAIILINITNISPVDKTLNLYILQDGLQYPTYDDNGNLLAGNEETIFLKNKIIQSGNSLLLNFEKILLAPGDSIYANCIEDDNSLVATISLEVY